MGTSLGLEEPAIRVEVRNELWTVEIPAGDGRPYGAHYYAAAPVGGTLAAGEDAKDVWCSRQRS